MNARLKSASVALCAALALSALGACSGTPSTAPVVSGPTSASSDTTPETPAVVVEDGPSEESSYTEDAPLPTSEALFGQTLTLPTGMAVTLSAPKAFKPSEYAAGIENFKKFVQFEVTIKNGTAERYDPSLFYATLASGESEGEQVFDSEKGMNGSPLTSIRPGKTMKFPIAFGVEDPKDLHAEVSVDFESDALYFNTK